MQTFCCVCLSSPPTPKIFKIGRQGERQRFRPFEELHNRQLLWHGSRATNYAGIMSQGLRIAPPEAPVVSSLFVVQHICAVFFFGAFLQTQPCLFLCIAPRLVTCLAKVCTLPTWCPRVQTTVTPLSRTPSASCCWLRSPSETCRQKLFLFCFVFFPVYGKILLHFFLDRAICDFEWKADLFINFCHFNAGMN